MKIRFVEGLFSATGGFRAGQVIEVSKLTPEMRRWLEPREGRPAIAMLVRDEPVQEVAVASESPAETATVGRSRRHTGSAA